MLRLKTGLVKGTIPIFVEQATARFARASKTQKNHVGEASPVSKQRKVRTNS